MSNKQSSIQIQQFRIKEHLAEVVDLLSTMDDDAVTGQLIRIDELARFNTMVQLAELQNELGDAISIYCSKTGQFIRQWEDQTLIKMSQIHGNEKTSYLLKRISNNHVATHWIYTDGNALEQLALNDPCGYFVYSASLILAPFQKSLENVFDNHQLNPEFLNNKRTCYNHISNAPLELVIQANEMLRRYLSLAQSLKVVRLIAFTKVELNEIAIDESTLTKFIAETKQTIINILNQAAKEGKIKPELSYSDVVQLNLAYGGHSNFRQQRKPKAYTDLERVMNDLDEFMPEVQGHHLYNMRLANKLAKAEAKEAKKPEFVSSGFKLKVPETSDASTNIKNLFAKLKKGS